LPETWLRNWHEMAVETRLGSNDDLASMPSLIWPAGVRSCTILHMASWLAPSLVRLELTCSRADPISEDRYSSI